MTIRNPIEWSGAQIVSAAHAAGALQRSLEHMQGTAHSPAPAVRRITNADIWQSLRLGFADFEAYRSDVIFLCATYALVGLVMARIAFGADLLPLLFPLASGFAIIGPLAAVGLYEMSRRREQGAQVGWANAFDVLKAPAIGSILVLGAALVALFLLWIFAAWLIYANTLDMDSAGILAKVDNGTRLIFVSGNHDGMTPTSVGAFLHQVFRTGAGQTMIVVGVGVGFLFALVAMMISVVSFPLLLDHDVGLDTAVSTSVKAVIANPGPMAVWGLTVAGGLLLGSLPAFIGLVVVIPVLGHATWHLYRKLVQPR